MVRHDVRARVMTRHHGYGTERVSAMRTAFRAELDELVTTVARMTRGAGQMLTNASIALHQSDVLLAGLVITDRDGMAAIYDETERRCRTLLALQAPVAGDLRVVVAVLRALGHVQRMGRLARHAAVMARLKHPNPMIAGEVRPVLARMSLLANQLAEGAAIALEHQDPLSGCRLALADDELDALLRHLFGILVAEDWPHGVARAVDAVLLGRYYERFGDHAVAIARQVCYLATGQVAVPDAVETATARPSAGHEHAAGPLMAARGSPTGGCWRLTGWCSTGCGGGCWSMATWCSFPRTRPSSSAS
jgi:phosphate transport system protein